MSIADSWGAVIESLSAGYRFLGKRVELILIPVFLDIWLWLAPKLSIAPLIENFVEYSEQFVGAQDLATLPMGMTPDLMVEMYASLNLMDSLVSTAFLHVPSLMVAIGPEIVTDVHEISNPVVAVGLFFGLSVLGLLIGVLYLNLLARKVPLGAGAKPATTRALVRQVLRHWMMVLLLIVAIIATLFAIVIPISMGMFFLGLISPALSAGVGMLMFVASIGLGFFIFISFFYVSAAIVLDDLPPHQAIMRSLMVVRGNFAATLIFMALTALFLPWGLTVIFSALAEIHAVGLAISIPINAYIGTGFALALFVLYRTSILRLTSARGTTAKAKPIGDRKE